eukprot:767096-Hanusia_phi.AAC.7
MFEEAYLWGFGSTTFRKPELQYISLHVSHNAGSTVRSTREMSRSSQQCFLLPDLTSSQRANTS